MFIQFWFYPLRGSINPQQGIKLTSNGYTFAWEESALTKMMRSKVRYDFTHIEQSYNSNLKNILLWTSFGEEKRACVNIVGLVGLFEIDWKIPQHNILVEILNNSKLDPKHNRIKVMLGEE
jgi:hypothetical protein